MSTILTPSEGHPSQVPGLSLCPAQGDQEGMGKRPKKNATVIQETSNTGFNLVLTTPG